MRRRTTVVDGTGGRYVRRDDVDTVV